MVLIGVPWLGRVSKMWYQKSIVTLIAEMHTSFDQGNGGSVGFGC